jgi:hypothetical protein
MFLQNDGNYPQDDSASHFTFSLLLRPQISEFKFLETKTNRIEAYDERGE